MSDPSKEPNAPRAAHAPHAPRALRALRAPHALWQLTLARWRTFFREPSALFWTFGFPLILSIALGIAFRSRPPDPVTVGIEAGPDALVLKEILERTSDVEASVMSAEAARAALRTGKVAIVIEPAAPRIYRFDPTRPESRLARAVVDDALQRAMGRHDATLVSDVTVTEPGSRYIDFLVPGLVGMGLMQSGLWGIGYAIVEMRTQKLVKRLVATPMKKVDFLLSFILMRALFLVFELPILIGFGALVFAVPMRGSIALLVAVSVVGSLTFSGIGLLIASRAKNTQTVSGLINLVSMPMFIGSGVFFSADRFPDAFQPLLRALPLTALNDALRAVMLDGASFAGIARPALTLGVWGAASFALALPLFRWR